MPKKIYLNTRDLYKEIIVSKGLGELTPKSKEYFYLLVKNISKKFLYSNIDDRSDCEGEAIIQLLKNWYLFDENKSENVFAYYTEVCKRGFAKGFNQLYKKDYKTSEYIVPIPFSKLFEDDNINI
jgi:hypothetical protein